MCPQVVTQFEPSGAAALLEEEIREALVGTAGTAAGWSCDIEHIVALVLPAGRVTLVHNMLHCMLPSISTTLHLLLPCCSDRWCAIPFCNDHYCTVSCAMCNDHWSAASFCNAIALQYHVPRYIVARLYKMSLWLTLLHMLRRRVFLGSLILTLLHMLQRRVFLASLVLTLLHVPQAVGGFGQSLTLATGVPGLC